MTKVLIVDDESPIREWIKYCIDKTFNCVFSTELSSNGSDALEKFRSNHHDIVITDIKMPIMDGLALIENIRAISPNTHIMILTSHSDFEYARTAVKYQIYDYILKTEITEEYLTDTLNKYLDNIKTDPYHTETYINREAVMHKLIGTQINPDEITMDFLKKYNIPLLDTALFSFAIRYNEPDSSFQNGLNLLNQNNEKIRNIFGFCYEKNTFVFCANIISTNSIMLQKQYLDDFIIGFFHANNECSIGVSPILYGIKDLVRSINSAIDNLSLSFYRRNTIINNNSLCNIHEIQSELNKLKLEVLGSVRNKDESAARTKLDSFLNYIRAREPHDINIVKSSCLQLLEEITNIAFSSSEQENSNEVYNLKTKINSFRAFNELESYVNKTFSNAFSEKKTQYRSYTLAIMKAISYLEKNYQTITGLNEVANYVYLNPEYFSRLFKDETGVNFSNFLNDYKLDRSLELLVNTNLKVHEIAELVGYSSLSYYSKIFKKKYGTNPFNYRNNIENAYNTTMPVL
ncbi:MAG TPA: response regulator [Clostridia bacterium]|nr:response regulator [Clostridia bacterium]